ncbi:type I restriction endonuclease subunit R [Candidatus Bipolaricaulota bacterium]|nr:type I restriction endonuclease subunit R [Candidatus Bipolaricaulota bacterium]
MTTDTTERGFEDLIVSALTGLPLGAGLGSDDQVAYPPAAYGGLGYLLGFPRDYDREYAIDLHHLREFLAETQPDVLEALDLDDDSSPTRRSFLARLQGEVTKRGVIDVLRKGIKHGPHDLELFYGTPSPNNPAAVERYKANRFSITRQLRYSRDETQLALDLCLFINGLPFATFELKNSLTKQTVNDAKKQYMKDRDPRELLFQFSRCAVHLAVDDAEVEMCTHLKGKASWFLPLNKGYKDGAGNPPNPNGLRTDYLWSEILEPRSLTNILENYAQIVELKDQKTGKKKRIQIFPRYHQLDVVRKLLVDAGSHGAGKRYLIQHSAGSGKSYSIAWLAHQLIGLRKDGRDVFDSIIVVTDRILLDKQIRETIKQYAQVASTVGAVTGISGSKTSQLTESLESGKKIIISTLQTFPFVLDEIGTSHRGRRFAIIIDEAHSSQGSRTSAKMSMALSGEAGPDEADTFEDKINKIMKGRKMLGNASYFAFTATPKNKTLEIFGEPLPPVDGKIPHRAFHTYTMRQAIQERFILDVLAHYTPVHSYYRLIKTVEGDPEFDTKKARKKLRRYVESNDHAIRLKAEIMVDHYHEQVVGLGKIGGQARAMVVTSSIERAIQYYHAIKAYLKEIKSPHQAIVAFSGEPEYKGVKVTEASLNRFASSLIREKIQEEPYRILVCAEKFQTGYDEPLLHTMYVDKVLSGIKAVQTLSRLNRARPGKHDVFVLDFMNDADTILAAFSDYYKTTVLSEETDENKLHDLKNDLDREQAYSQTQVDEFVRLYLEGAERGRLDFILDRCVTVYRETLDENQQVAFKGNAKAFVRTYNFLASILPYTNAVWEKLSIFLTFLVPKLPAPKDEDLSRGILEAIDMDSYRVEKKKAIQIQLPNEGGIIDPVPIGQGGHRPEPELDRLSNIIQSFNDQFGTNFTDADRIINRITDDIAPGVSRDKAYGNARRNSDKQNARIEHDKALVRVMTALVKDDTELFKQFSDNEGFRRWLTDTVFALTYEEAARN